MVLAACVFGQRGIAEGRFAEQSCSATPGPGSRLHCHACADAELTRLTCRCRIDWGWPSHDAMGCSSLGHVLILPWHYLWLDPGWAATRQLSIAFRNTRSGLHPPPSAFKCAIASGWIFREQDQSRSCTMTSCVCRVAATNLQADLQCQNGCTLGGTHP